eukprot:XP_016661730.1 PREDICTED: uncharacterized protein LOC107884368 [Acyrthosiphon pisum]
MSGNITHCTVYNAPVYRGRRCGGSRTPKNCLKAVILLWTGIIVFHSSVIAIGVNDMDIRAVTVNTCGGMVKNITVEYAFIRNEHNQHLFDWAYFIPNATYGPPNYFIIPLDHSPCNEEIQHKFQKIESPVKLELFWSELNVCFY